VSQIQNTVTRPETMAQPLSDHRSMVRALMAVALIAALIAAVFALRPGLEQAVADPATAVTDGWLHGSLALGVVSAGRSADVTDGWASRYLASASTGQVTDGWASRYLPSLRGD
jgi:hypothetical protein